MGHGHNNSIIIWKCSGHTNDNTIKEKCEFTHMSRNENHTTEHIYWINVLDMQSQLSSDNEIEHTCFSILVLSMFIHDHYP